MATLAGWYTTEIGRQPWLVSGVLTTADAVGPVPAVMILSTLIVYLVVYVLLAGAYIAVLVHLSRKAVDGQAAAQTRPAADVAAANSVG